MERAVLQSCLPWAGVLAMLLGIAWVLARLGGGRFQPGRLRQLHSDQHGSAQTLAFVLTLPVFMMVILFILQVSQVMIGIGVVHYAAYATARAAVVWIPAKVTSGGLIAEGENCISLRVWDPTVRNQTGPVLSPYDPISGPVEGIVPYKILPGSPKYDKIASAAKLACLPICPSRDLGLPMDDQAQAASSIMLDAYHGLAPRATADTPATDRRLNSKMAYACARRNAFSMWMRDPPAEQRTWQSVVSDNTAVEIHCYHSGMEPPLDDYYWANVWHDSPYEPNEVGWQDPIAVKVTHYMALLPGPGLLLFKYLQPTGKDGTGDAFGFFTGSAGRVFVYRLTAECTLGNEGQKSVHPYECQLN